MLRNDPEERSYCLLRGGSLNSPVWGAYSKSRSEILKAF